MSGDRRIEVRRSGDFGDWAGLLALIHRAFAYMHTRIAPPSSALLLTPESLEEKAAREVCLLAFAGERLVGCAFLADRGDSFYLGKVAVEPDMHGRGVGSALMQAVEQQARDHRKVLVELETRIELVENHATFQRFGFREVKRTAHAGFDRPTSLTMQKVIA